METKELTEIIHDWYTSQPGLLHSEDLDNLYMIVRQDKLQALDRLREDIARDMRMIHHDGHNKVNHPTSHTQIGADNIQPDRISILQIDLTKYL